MSDFVREMHTTSGLLADLESATLTIAEAEKQILAHIQQYVPGPRKTPLAGQGGDECGESSTGSQLDGSQGNHRNHRTEPDRGQQGGAVDGGDERKPRAPGSWRISWAHLSILPPAA